MYVGTVTETTGELHETLQRLIPQLGPHKVGPSWDELETLIRSEATTLVIAREPDANGPIVGILSLTVYRVPTGVRSIIEDVVVDSGMRRRGIGEALVRRAIEVARDAGAEGVALTSNPKREAANLLYQAMGFELRQTNPYYYRLK
jgi:ribosomal protein S18 acetylase RimI-like enzyme